MSDLKGIIELKASFVVEVLESLSCRFPAGSRTGMRFLKLLA
jgi:hypothetical protein